MIELIQNTLSTKLIDAADMGEDSEGSTSIQGITCYAVQAIWSSFNGDTAALITTYGSNDNINFTQVDSIIPSGTTGSYLLNVEKAGYRYVKVAYTQTAGDGELTVTISGKVI